MNMYSHYTSFLTPMPRRHVITLARANTSLLFQAAKHTVDSYVKNGMVIGLGAGDASAMTIQYLGLQLRSGSLKDIVAIATSVGSASEAAKAGIPLEHFEEGSKVDITFDDADVIEEETLSAVIGRRKSGEESLIQEKSVLRASSKVVLIATEKQCKDSFEGSIPVLIRPVSWLETAEEIDDLFLGDAEVWRRPSIGHADPLGGDFPLVTKDGYNVLDVIFTSPVPNLAGVAETLDQVKGVVDHGIIYNLQCTAVIATAEGLHIHENAQTIQ
ncbi:hypothetical protein Leryth_011053 [Lithospermum erythrorhizon]|nr:hypothetical protein Leryth_011053 [Lithospermum erythrorhizon]